MKTGTLIAIGVGTLIVGGVAAVALAAGGGVTKYGVTWDEAKCMPINVDTRVLAGWFNEHLRRLVSEQNITTGEQLVTAVMVELLPESCRGRFPPEPGTPEYREWQLALASYSDLYQQLVDTIVAEAGGAAAAWRHDPSVAFANAMADTFGR